MAIPVSRNETYVGGTTPTIKAATLNDLQDYVVHAFQGTKTLKKLQVDGSGNNATSVPDGALAMSRTLSADAAFPATMSPLGVANRESLVMGSGVFDAAGNPSGGVYNIVSCSLAVSLYTVTFGFVANGPDPDRATFSLVARTAAGTGYFPSLHNVILDGSNRLQASFAFYSATATPVTTPFQITCFTC